MLLSEQVYCVAIAFRMTEWVPQWICIQFCIKLEHSSVETIQVIQKATAMGNWWLAASSWQCACSGIMSPAEFFGEISNHPGDSAPLQPCGFWLFPKLKSPLKGKRFQTVMRFRKIRWDSWWRLAELCEVPRCLLWRGLRGHRPMYKFLVSWIFFNKCLY